jgi:hypothetical protein
MKLNRFDIAGLAIAILGTAFHGPLSAFVAGLL